MCQRLPFSVAVAREPKPSEVAEAEADNLIQCVTTQRQGLLNRKFLQRPHQYNGLIATYLRQLLRRGPGRYISRSIPEQLINIVWNFSIQITYRIVILSTV